MEEEELSYMLYQRRYLKEIMKETHREYRNAPTKELKDSKWNKHNELRESYVEVLRVIRYYCFYKKDYLKGWTPSGKLSNEMRAVPDDRQKKITRGKPDLPTL